MSRRDRPAIPAEPNASDEAHDVLAAEQFAMPAPEAARPAGPVTLPADPAGGEEPHDVLAAEQFAMPAPPPGTPFAPVPPRRSRSRRAGLAAGLFGLAALLHRRHRDRRH